MIAARNRAAKLGLLEGAKSDGTGGGALSQPQSATSGPLEGGRSKRREANDDSTDSVGSFSTRQRQQTLEMLLSRERVLSLLYAKVILARFYFFATLREKRFASLHDGQKYAGPLCGASY